MTTERIPEIIASYRQTAVRQKLRKDMKKLTRANIASVGIKAAEPNPARRSWLVSLVWACVLVGGSVILSAVINPLFGRYVHWYWMAGLAPALFIAIAAGLRWRWV